PCLTAQRAFIMLVCLLGAQIVRLQIPMNVRMLVALLLIVLINPLSVFLDGLYLSFLCVLVLTLSLSGNLKSPTAWRTAGASQLYLFWLLFPLSVYCFQTFSWQSPWVNLFAIPFFGVFVLPLIILFTVSWGVSVYVPSFEWATDFTLSCLNLGLERFSEAIAWCQSLNEVFSSPQILSMDTHRLLLLLGLSLLIALSTFKRWLLLYGVIVLAALFPNTLQPRADVEMVVFDVGQGLSVLFRTQHHTLLYDVGGRFASGFNMAQGVILPFLSRHNIDSIDALVVSHNDNDHAGALSDLVRSVPVKRLLVGDKRTLKRVNPERAEQCEHQSWEWDGVSFQIVYSRPDAPASNDRSCVLLVTWGSQRVMLTGDISKRAERDILNTYTAEQLRSNVLIAPHHGSNTSSSPSFVNTVHPQHVVFSVGYQHRFGHPHKPVVQRYQTTNSRLWRTDRHGAISFAWDADKTLTTRSHTEGIQRFWNRSHASLHTD
ncbi:MAG: DNA internalization-related competence protein ComEC/Rec2, partial [Pseudomonadota bacterium]